jgi:hypothetical protein
MAELQYQLAPDVVLVPVDDGSARLLNLGGSFYALSKSGSEMLGAVLSHGSEQAARDIAGRYGVDAARVATDLGELLAKLRGARLVRMGSSEPWHARLRASCARITAACLFAVTAGQARPRRLLLLARLCILLFGWENTASTWSRIISARTQGGVPPPKASLDALLDKVDADVRKAASALPSMACKERALCAWFILCSRGIPATLVVGIHLYPLAGHCWCEVGSRKLTDFEDRCETYLPVARYTPGAARVTPPGIRPAECVP